MSQKSVVIGMALTLVVALGLLTVAYGTGAEQFNLGYGLLMTVVTLVVSAIIVFAITGFQWWLTHR